MLGKRDQNLLKANTEKPIFIVSNNREIINQKQRVIHPQVQIYHDVKQNFSQRQLLNKSMVCPLQDSLEFRNTGGSNFGATTKQRCVTGKVNRRKEIRQAGLPMSSSPKDNDRRKLSPVGSAGSFYRLQNRKLNVSKKPKKKIVTKENKYTKTEKKAPNKTLRLFTPKTTKLLELVNIKRVKTVASIESIKLPKTKSCHISPKYEHKDVDENTFGRSVQNAHSGALKHLSYSSTKLGKENPQNHRSQKLIGHVDEKDMWNVTSEMKQNGRHGWRIREK